MRYLVSYNTIVNTKRRASVIVRLPSLHVMISICLVLKHVLRKKEGFS